MSPGPCRAHADAVTALFLSADGSQVLTGSADKTVRLATFANGQAVRTVEGTGRGDRPRWRWRPTARSSPAARPTTASSCGTARTTPSSARRSPTAGRSTRSPSTPAATQLLTGGGDGLLKLWALPPIPGKSLVHPDAVTVRRPQRRRQAPHHRRGRQDRAVAGTWPPTPPPAGAAVHRPHRRRHRGRPVGQRPAPRLGRCRRDDPLLEPGQRPADRPARRPRRAADGAGLQPRRAQLLSAVGGRQRQGLAVAARCPQDAGPRRPGDQRGRQPRRRPACSPAAPTRRCGSGTSTTSAIERPFAGQTLGVTAVAFNGNGTSVAAGGADKSVIVWNAADAKEVKKFADSAGRGQRDRLQPRRQVRRRRPRRQQSSACSTSPPARRRRASPATPARSPAWPSRSRATR